MVNKPSFWTFGAQRRVKATKRTSDEAQISPQYAGAELVKTPYEEGREARYAPVSLRNPYSAHSSAHEAWEAGYAGE